MMQEMFFKNKTRNYFYAKHADIQKKKTVQVYRVWTNIMVARKKTFCRISLLNFDQKINFL